VAATVLGLAMGLSRILGTGRDEALLRRVKAIAPDRVDVMTLGNGSSGDWAKAVTGGEGADFVISALGAKAPAATSSIQSRVYGAAERSSTWAVWRKIFRSTSNG
jgi:NADPH:quinone reductase-like Zn-dependent oxidoreductase